MPKKRKTRKQKITVDQKQKMVHESVSYESSSPSNAVTQIAHSTNAETNTQEVTFSLPTNDTSSVQKESRYSVAQVAISTDDYGYLGKDLVRTVLLSGAIVLAELLIRLWFRG